MVRAELDRRPYSTYVYSVLESESRSVTVLCNVAYPVLAFSDEPDNLYLTRRFVDESALAAAFSDVSPFHVASFEMLTAETSAASLDAMSASEAATVRYWIRYGQLTQVGDLIYNDWD